MFVRLLLYVVVVDAPRFAMIILQCNRCMYNVAILIVGVVGVCSAMAAEPRGGFRGVGVAGECHHHPRVLDVQTLLR